MPKQKQSDGSVKVEFKTKDGKTVLFSRKPAKKRAAEAAETEAPAKSSSSAQANKKGGGDGGQSKDRPTDLQPVLVLSDD